MMVEENHDKLSVLYIGTVFEWALWHFKGDESQFAFVVIFSLFHSLTSDPNKVNSRNKIDKSLEVWWLFCIFIFPLGNTT